MQFDYHSWLRHLSHRDLEAMHMEISHRRIENLERILRELMQIYALAPGAQPCQFRMWLDLAITETRFQIEKMRMETVH